MIRRIVLLIGLALLPAVTWAASDLKFNQVMTVKLPIFDTSPTPSLVASDGAGNALALGTTVSVLVKCGGQSPVILDAADPWSHDGGGIYTVTTTTTDGITASDEDICTWSVVGIGSMAGLLDPSYQFRKAIGHSMYELVAATVPGETLNLTGGRADAQVKGMDADTVTAAAMSDALKRRLGKVTAACDISGSTSGSSFTISTCVDADGNAITLADDQFNGLGLIAITNGGATCNVNGQAVLIEDTTAAGVISAKTDAPLNSGFKAAPNTTNCGAEIGL